jgi:hypothetical protein
MGSTVESEHSVRDTVERAEREAFESLQAQVKEQEALWQLIPLIIRHAESTGLRLDQRTRFCRGWATRQESIVRIADHHTDTCPEYSGDFWYVGRGGQGTMGRVGISLENADFVMVGRGGLQTDFPIHLLIDCAREQSEQFDAMRAIETVAREIQRKSEAAS